MPPLPLRIPFHHLHSLTTTALNLTASTLHHTHILLQNKRPSDDSETIYVDYFEVPPRNAAHGMTPEEHERIKAKIVLAWSIAIPLLTLFTFIAVWSVVNGRRCCFKPHPRDPAGWDSSVEATPALQYLNARYAARHPPPDYDAVYETYEMRVARGAAKPM